MKILVSCDDGNKKDFILARLLKKYNLTGIFFIANQSNKTDLTDSEIVKLYDMGFEIGGHTWSHPEDMKELSPKQLYLEIIKNKNYLENLIHNKLYWFCFPGGRHNQIVDDVVRKSGYMYARTTVIGKTKDTDDFIQHTSVHVHNSRKEYNSYGNDWVKFAEEQFFKAKANNGLFHLWGHSWEINGANEWGRLEKFLAFIAKESRET
jgi:peptidoglycan/xylan/chitin deacetylase (PgdA/CDA1 family)